MIATPPLGRRVVLAGVGVVVLVLVLVSAFVYVALRVSLDNALDDQLSDRAASAQAEAVRHPPDVLAERLRESGVRAVVRAADGTTYYVDPSSPLVVTQPPPTVNTGRMLARTVPIPGGGGVTVFVRAAERDATLRQLLTLEVAGSLGAVQLAALLLRRASALALSPVAAITAAAARTARGREGERLRPDRPETELGRMAMTYDEMLDVLEAAVRDARAAEERSSGLAQELQHALDDVKVAADEARRSEAATRRFLADAAHQLRTPVAGIRACAETLLRGGAQADHDRLLATMVRETGRAGRLISSLLQMARLDQGEPLAPIEAVDVVRLVREEADRVDLLATWLTVTTSATDDSQGHWLLPGSALREIVSNLLDNARRHARSRVDVITGIHDGRLEIRVLDDGPGVAADDAERIFERFVSLDAGSGSGLGLAVARGMARAMGGDVRYDAGFMVTLPAVAPLPA